MLKTINKYCVFEEKDGNAEIIDAYSTSEQAEFKATQKRKEYQEWFNNRVERNGIETQVRWYVKEANVKVFKE